MDLSDFLLTGVFAFMLGFVRLGTALMIMPGIGDNFVSPRVRLLMALGITLVFWPIVYMKLPAGFDNIPSLIVLMVSEFIIGLMIGTVARMFMTALDVGGMIISMQSGLSNAQLFNPIMASQGSIVGAFLSVTGIVLLFETHLHALLLYGLIDSYTSFPPGEMPNTEDMAMLIAKSLSAAFMIGVKIAAPFLIVSTLLFVSMGVLSRLMPQIQVFLIALPMQIMMSLLILVIAASSIFMFWLSEYDKHLGFFLTSGQ